MIVFRALLLLAVAGTGGAAGVRAAGTAHQRGLSITFLANEGVMLSATDSGRTRQVLVDALFEPYESYAVPAESTQAALRSARTPYDSADVILVTHRHGDHFHPAPVAQYLRANPRAVIVAPRQVIDSLQDRLTPELRRGDRIAARTLAPGTRRMLLVNGIPIQVLGLAHGGRRHRHVEHLAFVVDLGGRRILHVGDAELSETALAPLRIDTMGIDVALLPYWALTDTDTRRAVERWIRPGRIAAIHLASGDTAARREIRSAAPQARVFLEPLQRMQW